MILTLFYVFKGVEPIFGNFIENECNFTFKSENLIENIFWDIRLQKIFLKNFPQQYFLGH